MARTLSVCVAFSVLCVAAVGCTDSGPDLGEVHGKVTMDGKPLPNAIVSFTPLEGGRGSTGRTNENGEYTLIYADQEGALPGKHRVRIASMPESVEPQEEYGSDDPRYGQQSSAADYAKAGGQRETIPPRYNTESNLEEEVTDGDNEINFDLTSR